LRVTWMSLLINLILSGLKFTAGIIGHSQAVAADAAHSLSDTTTDLAILLGARFWSQPPDSKHPYGHRRIETLVTLFIGIILTAAGISLAWNAISTIHTSLSSPQSTVHSPEATPSWLAFWAAIISMITKEALCRYTLRVGKSIKSISLEANAYHHRSDALSSIPAALAVAIAAIKPEWQMADPIAAILIGVMILHVAFKITWPQVSEILESGASEQARDEISTLARTVEGVRDIHKVRTRYVGAQLHIDLHVQVDKTMFIENAHNISMEVTHRIKNDGPGVHDVIVHIEPFEDAHS
ncbi:hypothetical protein BVX97_00610, partial [bacterium E08(2017)]